MWFMRRKCVDFARLPKHGRACTTRGAKPETPLTKLRDKEARRRVLRCHERREKGEGAVVGRRALSPRAVNNYRGGGASICRNFLANNAMAHSTA